ncbi:hypothetical protein MAPG_09892 [Magnaporthiopsis poae ATCC 64411]|uniref:Protein kinase domain-containing protein n=1 Tax=Magnaporthiopsis poae (strain ATCC 64411 / 73-15) TaxID=644358 RepID=A0A0C4EB47_MAGP6|nr:hypothetical protein MAPG_09892 [Magnaporthiopsis poae ATCC 64411]
MTETAAATNFIWPTTTRPSPRDQTEIPRLPQTPARDSLTLTKGLGERGLRDRPPCLGCLNGRQYARKQPRKDIKSKNDLEAWSNEAYLMQQISHPSIVKLLGFREGPPPSLELEYVDGGLKEIGKETGKEIGKEISNVVLLAAAAEKQLESWTLDEQAMVVSRLWLQVAGAVRGRAACGGRGGTGGG